MDIKPFGSTEPIDADQGTSSAPRVGESVERGTGDEKYSLQFSTEYPVKEVKPEELQSVIDNFRSSVGAYYKDKDGKPVSAPPLPLPPQTSEGSVSNRPSGTVQGPTPYPPGQKDRVQLPHAPTDFIATGWNNRGIRSRRIAQLATVPMREDSQLSRYDLGDNQSAAIMHLHHRNDEIGQQTSIETLATHPGTTGAGRTMVEHAVNVSEAAGQKGYVGPVHAVNSESEQFFRKQGFEGNAKFLRLDPSKKKDLWAKNNDGKWEFKENEGKKYGSLVPKSNAEPSSSIAPSKRRNELSETQPEIGPSKRRRP